VIARAALVLLAAAAIAWLSLALVASRAADDLERVVVGGGAPPAELADLRARAERLVPDRRPTLVEATGLAQAGRRALAARRLRDLLAAEPENAEAWLLLSRTTPDPAEAERASARVRALAPPAPPPPSP
jgi:hypothetical protein